MSALTKMQNVGPVGKKVTTSECASLVKRYTADIKIMDRTIAFKLDTRVDVTIVSQTVFDNIFSNEKQPVLQKAEKPLRRIPLPFC